MPARTIAVLVSLLCTGSAFAQDPPAPRDVTLSAADGTQLKATYYAAAKPGPAVMLLHMCNTTRASWTPLGPQLAAAGIHAISMDYRGFGESGGDRFDKMPGADAQAMIADKWPGDVDTVYAFLAKQPGVDGTRVGAAGGSCGVIQAVQFARRHPEIKSLVLLAGPTDPDGLTFLEQNSWLPVFAAAAADDQYDANTPELMQWILAISGNPRNKFSGFKDGKHGTEIFGPHPELPKQITSWFVDTLEKNPADRTHAVAPTGTPMREFWRKAEAPDTVAAAVQMFHDARAHDAHAVLFPEAALNLLGYQHLQAGRAKEAIALFKLNTEAYPTSANTFDSLGDGYLADGQNELALQASRTAIDLLAADASPEDRKAAIRTSAEQKIAKLTKREN